MRPVITKMAGAQDGTAVPAGYDPDLAQQLDALSGFSGFLTTLVEAWPPERFSTRPAAGGRSLAEHLCHLRDIEVDAFSVRITKLRWCDNPVLEDFDGDAGRAAGRPWRIALYELFQARLGNVAVLRRANLESLEKSGSLGKVPQFTLRDLIRQMHAHDVAHMADLFQLATECGTWPDWFQQPEHCDISSDTA